MSTEEEGSNYRRLSRESYIVAYSRVAQPGEAKCCKCDWVAFVYPGDVSHMGMCIVCIRAATEKKMRKMEMRQNGGLCGPMRQY